MFLTAQSCEHSKHYVSLAGLAVGFAVDVAEDGALNLNFPSSKLLLNWLLPPPVEEGPGES